MSKENYKELLTGIAFGFLLGLTIWAVLMLFLVVK